MAPPGQGSTPEGTSLAGILPTDSIDDASVPQLIGWFLSPPVGQALSEIAHAIQKAAAAVAADAPRAAGADAQTIYSWIASVVPLGNLALQSVVRQLTEAIPHAKAMSAAGTAQQNRPQVADPVDPATGELVHTHVDLRLDGGGIAAEFTRRYRSNGRYPNGSLGASWDHSLNFYLRELPPDSVIASSGEFREDRYVLASPSDGTGEYFAAPSGIHSTIERVSDPASPHSFILTRPDGMTYRYEADPGPAPSPGLHRIERIVDRFGNQLIFEYDPGIGRLSRVYVNDPARRIPQEAPVVTRYIWFDYDDLGRIIALHDSTGRTVWYTYDEYDDLVTVTLPPTDGYRLGRSIFYEYSSPSGPVAHQLLSVVDADGRRYLDVEYGAEEGFLDYGRVVRERNDEGEWLFEYAALEQTDPPGPNTATRYTRITRPSGHIVELEINAAGNVLTRREVALDEDGLPTTAVARFAYNADGGLLANLTPGRVPEPAALPWAGAGIEHGMLTQRRFGREDFEALPAGLVPAAERRRAFGNRVKLVRRASPAWPPPDIVILQPDDIMQEFSYQNPYQQLTSETDPRDLSLVTRYHYDPFVTRGALIPVPAAVTRIQHPATTAPDGTTQPGTTELFAYDPLGRPTLVTDGEGHKTARAFFGPADAAPSDDDPSRPVTTDGHLKSVTVGVGELDATTSFQVNARGAITKVTNPRGGVTRSYLDARDLAVRVERVLTGTGAGELAYASTFRYDAEGKLQSSQRDVQDDTGAPRPAPVEAHFFAYGDTGQLLRESIGEPDPRTWLSTRHVYDGEGLRTRTITPLGNITHVRYDAQRHPAVVTRGFGTAAASTARIHYDLGGRKRAEIDPLGHVTRYECDRFGRLERIVQVVDVADQTADTRPLAAREGHTRVFDRDAAGNIVLERFFEWTAPGQYRLLTRTRTSYDERSRPTKVIRDLFDAPVPASSLDDFSTTAPAGSVQVETWQFYDATGKVAESRDGVLASGPKPYAGSSVRFAFDAAGRQLSKTIRLLELAGVAASTTATTYDADGNPVRVDQIDNKLDPAGNIVAQELIGSGAEYDLLDRKTADIDGLGNRTLYRYDSRDLALTRTDPLGNTITSGYDRYGRLAMRTEHINAATPIVIRYAYDDDNRLIGLYRDDITGKTWSTEYAYDALGRRVLTTLAPCSPLERRYQNHYDPADNLVSLIRPNGLRDTRTYDALNRMVRLDYDFASADPAHPAAGASFEGFGYDGLGRLIEARTDTTTVAVKFDSLGRAWREDQTLGNSVATLARKFDSFGNRTTLVYPSGRTIGAEYDSMSRLTRIDDIVPSATGAPPIPGRRVVEKTWIGAAARRNEYANGFAATYERDAAGRRLSFDFTDAAGSSRLRLLQLFDGAGNRAQDWQAGTEATSSQSSIAYGYDGVNWLTTSGQSSQTPPKLAPPILPPRPRSGGAPPPPLGGQNAVNGAVGTTDLGITHSYLYDAGGNRTDEFSPANPPVSYTVDPLDRDTSQMSDLNGNTLDAADSRRFDAHDRLVVAEGNFQGVYDALGRRVALDDGTAKRRYIFDGGHEISEYNGFDLSSLDSETVTGISADERIETAKAGHTYIVHQDHVGSTRMVSDEAGAIVARFDYDPYGRTVRETGLAGIRHRFMGRELDASLNLYHFRSRHYDFTKARFLQRDPADARPERSPYQAFADNPLVFVDPMGSEAGHPGEIPAMGQGESVPFGLNLWGGVRDPANPFGLRFHYSRFPTIDPTPPPSDDPFVSDPHFFRARYLFDRLDPNDPWYVKAWNRISFADAAWSGELSLELDILGAKAGNATSKTLGVIGDLLRTIDPNGSVSGTLAADPYGGAALEAGVQYLKVAGLARFAPAAAEAELISPFEQVEASLASRGIPAVVSASGSARATLAANRSWGLNWEQTIVPGLRSMVPVGWTVSSQERFLTRFGWRVLDVVVRDNAGRIVGAVEAKTGAAQYGWLQRLKDRWLMEQLQAPIFEYRYPFSHQFLK